MTDEYTGEYDDVEVTKEEPKKELIKITIPPLKKQEVEAPKEEKKTMEFGTGSVSDSEVHTISVSDLLKKEIEILNEEKPVMEFGKREEEKSSDHTVKVSDLLKQETEAPKAEKETMEFGTGSVSDSEVHTISVSGLLKQEIEEPKAEKETMEFGTGSVSDSEVHTISVSGLLKQEIEAPKVGNSTKVGEDEDFTVIIDIGQGTTKVGFAGDPNPKVFPTVIGKPKYKQTMASAGIQELYVGSDTQRMRGVLSLEYPISRGNVMNWDHYYALLSHIFNNELRVDPKKCNIIYVVPPLTPPESSLYFARVLLETHQIKSIAILDSATTSAFSVGITTGLTVEIGEGITTIAPVLDGKLYPPSIQRLNLAGVDILHNLKSLLSRYGTALKDEILREIKTQSCTIVSNAETGGNDPNNNENFTMPDGENLEIPAYVSVWTGEVLFQPHILGYNMANIPQSIISAIKNTHQGYWRKLLKNIVLSGGTTQFKGLKKRLQQDLEILIPELGQFPPEQKEVEKPSSEKEMIQIKIQGKKAENCSKCGELLKPNMKFCNHCGNKVEQMQINIAGAEQAKYPNKCPKCNEKLDGNSPFCGVCGTKLSPILEKHDINRKDKKEIKKSSLSNKKLEEMMKMVEDEYGGAGSLSSIDEKINTLGKGDGSFNSGLINIIESKDQAIAAFKGASVLGAIPSFKQFMVNKEQYDTDPNSTILDFATVVKTLKI